MKKVGFVGWRGMVGSVLMKRMNEENDFANIIPHFYSASNSGANVIINGSEYCLLNANSLTDLTQMDIIVSTQGGEYTKVIFPQLRSSGWNGYWIDAASALRMHDDACIILDPVNDVQIQEALKSGVKTFVGGNCSITLVMLGLAGLLKSNLIEWMNIVTFQAASGAGAKHVKELLLQNAVIAEQVGEQLSDNNLPVLDLIDAVDVVLKSNSLPITNLLAPLSNNIIPWIDSDLGNGNSREEWKGCVELNKILGLAPDTIKVDGYCVRVATLRCHSAAITMKLKEDLSLVEIENIIKNDHEWVKFIANDKLNTLKEFTPVSISQALQVYVGRLKKMSFGENIYGVMTIGDQLLWGAAEPLRRILKNFV